MAIEAVSDIKRAGASAFSGGGGGGVSFSSATLNVAQALRFQAEGFVTDPAATVNSKVLCQLVPNADWDADDLAEFGVIGSAFDGQILFTITRPGPLVGDFSILYALG